MHFNNNQYPNNWLNPSPFGTTTIDKLTITLYDSYNNPLNLAGGHCEILFSYTLKNSTSASYGENNISSYYK